MGKPSLFVFIFMLPLFCFAGNGTGLTSYSASPSLLSNNGTPAQKASKFNLKIQPAFFWASVGLEAELILSAKISVALNVVGKYGVMDGKNKTQGIRKEDFINQGFMVELIGRYYINLSKKNLSLAPLGFYVQASAGYNKLLYFDGSVRPFSLHTRFRTSPLDPSIQSDFPQPQPFIGGLGVGYQIELLRNKVIANLGAGAQANSDRQGLFFTIYVSPSLGMMF